MIDVRMATPDEWGEAGSLAEAAYRANGHFDVDEGYSAVVRDAAGRAEPGPLLVAFDGSQMVGTATVCHPGTPHAEVSRAGEVEFRFLAVHADHQGRGIAHSLVDAVVEEARLASARRVVCCVISWNVKGHALYESHGFARQPDRDWSPVPGVDLWAYALELD